MEITENADAPVLLNLVHHSSFQKVDLRVRNTVRVRPPSVQINPHEGASTITNRYPIRIKHGYKFNHILSEYFLVPLWVLRQLSYDLGHDPTSRSLGSVEPCLQEDTLLLVNW